MRDVAVAATATLVVLLAGGVLAGPAVADERTVPGPLRFEGGQDALFELDAGRRFLDTVEFRTTGRGPVLVNELDTDLYVAGIAEMPTRWPIEALKAQAVAARTYAWYSIERGAWEGYDLCATVACQVFRGADAFLEPATGHRWLRAVEETSGEVLVDDDGRPVLARYFSTSGGRTYPNEAVFPRDGAHDHLVGIDDPFDAVSPLHRWEARFTREEFDAILSRGDTLGATTPIASVDRLGPVDDPRASLRVTGRNGVVVEVSARDFRAFVSSIAPRLFPDRFPGLRPDGERPLPTAVPSSRFEVHVRDDEVVIDGQGWGHGVGMGQYGAMGRAERGDTYREILGAYYAGLEPVRAPDLPERIRVGIELGGGESTVRPDRVVSIVAGGEVVVERALGTWAVARDGDGWRLTPPQNHDAELETTPTEHAAAIGRLSDAVVVEAAVNKPVLLRLEVADTTGRTVLVRDLGAGEAGLHAATWRLADADGQRVPPGRYDVMIVAEDADGTVEGTPVTVTVEPPPVEEPEEAAPAPAAPGTDPGSGGVPAPTVAIAIVVLGAAAALAAAGAARRRATTADRRAAARRES